MLNAVQSLEVNIDMNHKNNFHYFINLQLIINFRIPNLEFRFVITTNKVQKNYIFKSEDLFSGFSAPNGRNNLFTFVDIIT